MGISWAQTTSLTCPQCGEAFEAEVWLIVDSTRPDLLDRIRNDTLHELICPQCNQRVGQVDAPLLLFRPSETPPLLYSPAQRTTTEQVEEQALGLVDILRKGLGEYWKDTWLEQGLAVVPRLLLSAALSDDPELAIRQAAEQMQQELEALGQQDPETYHHIIQQSEQLNQQVSAL